jgi:hypothetical protein
VLDTITRRLAELATIVCVALVLFYNSLAPSKGTWDDLAVMRSAAWLAPCGPDAPLVRTLRAHFEQYRAALSRVDQMRYQKRAELVDSYPLSAAVIRALERAGRTPVLRNVVNACWLQHVFVLLVVVLLVGWRQPWLVLALLVAGLAAAYAWPWSWADWLPFHRYSQIWTASPPRGASTLAWCGAVMAGVTQAGRRRIASVLVLLLLSWLCHRSMALLCLAASLPPLVLLALARRRLYWPPAPGLALAAFCAVALLAAGVKLALIGAAQGRFPLLFTASGTGSAAEVRNAGELLLSWAMLSLAALELWRRSRARLSTEPDATALREAGDTVAWLLAVTAAVSLGLNVAHPPIEVWYGPLFFVWEVAMRIGAVPHILFFALLGLTVLARAPRLVPPLALSAALLGALLVGRELGQRHGRPLPEQRRSLPKLLAKGRGAYADEVQYYLAVGSEVVEQGCAGRTPWSAPP